MLISVPVLFPPKTPKKQKPRGHSSRLLRFPLLRRCLCEAQKTPLQRLFILCEWNSHINKKRLRESSEAFLCSRGFLLASSDCFMRSRAWFVLRERRRGAGVGRAPLRVLKAQRLVLRFFRSGGLPDFRCTQGQILVPYHSSFLGFLLQLWQGHESNAHSAQLPSGLIAASGCRR